MSKTPGGNKKTIGSIRAKAGMPAKAGRRKVYGKGSKHKTKHFGEGRGFSLDHDVKLSVAVAHRAPSGKALRDNLRIIHNLEREDHTLGSDPFKWKRIRAHVLSGIVNSGDIKDRHFV
jgi:hypothetical protein